MARILATLACFVALSAAASAGDGDKAPVKGGNGSTLQGVLVGVSLDGFLTIRVGVDLKSITLTQATTTVGAARVGAEVRVQLEPGSETRATRVEFKEPPKEEEARPDNGGRNRRGGGLRRGGRGRGGL